MQNEREREILDDEPANRRESEQELDGFPRRFWDGEMDLTDKRTKAIYGTFHWNRLAANMRKPRFDEALRIAADRNVHA